LIIYHGSNVIVEQPKIIKGERMLEDLFNQILFHTEKSLTYCRFLGYEQLGGVK
jgi:hypothetical protein